MAREISPRLSTLVNEISCLLILVEVVLSDRPLSPSEAAFEVSNALADPSSGKPIRIPPSVLYPLIRDLSSEVDEGGLAILEAGMKNTFRIRQSKEDEVLQTMQSQLARLEQFIASLQEYIGKTKRELEQKYGT